MAEPALATVTIPAVTPDTTGWPEAEAPAGPVVPDDSGGDGGEHRSPLDGLKALTGPKARGGGGGGSRSRRARPGGRNRFDLRNSWQILVGSLLVPLGVVFILMAWYGAAHTAYVQQQVPYLVSGAFVGLGCMVLGGLLYWAHWLYRMYDQAELHHEEELRMLAMTLQAVTERLGAADFDTGPVPSLSSGSAAALARGEAPTGSGYVATPSGSVYHLANCPVVAHHPEGLRTVGGAQLTGLEPCRICLPGHS